MKSYKPYLTRCVLRAGVILACTGVAVSAASSYSDAVLRDGPIGYWQFNDGVVAPVVDTAANLGSLGAAAAGVYNGAVHPVAGVLAPGTDKAASTIGGTHVAIPRVEEINASGEFTAEGWFKPGAITTDAAPTCAFSSGDFANPRGGWLVYQIGGGFSFRLYNKNGTAASGTASGGGTISVGSWYHVVGVFTGSKAILYVNGVEAASADVSSYVPGNAGGFTIGMRADNSFGWNGTADEVAYYGAALSSSQVAAHYAAGRNPAPEQDYSQTVLADSPLGYWRLNEAAFVPPVATNAGSLGASAAGAYRGGALNASEAPNSTGGFIGFDDNNTSLDLNGVNAYVSTLQGLLNGKPRFTISGWIRRGADQANRTGLWGQNDLVEFGYIDNNKLEAWTDGGLDLSPNPFPNETWAHLAIVADGTRITMYTNGIAAISRNHNLPADNTFTFNIGGGGVFDGSGNFFKGQIDEVALYDKDLSAAQICNQYAAGVPTAPMFVGSLAPVTVYAGATVEVPAVVCGSPGIQYQWYHAGGAAVAGATGPTLVIPNAKTTDSGEYYLSVSNGYGSADSDPVAVEVLPSAPPIVELPPIAMTRYAGIKASFKVVVAGTPPFTYQWQRNEKNIEGATSATLTLDPVTTDLAGDYRVIVKNPIDTVTSPSAALTVVTPATGYESAMVATRPAGYWRLGESEGTTAFDYAGGFDGTYNNVALAGSSALAGDDNASAQFNGTDSYVSTPAQLNSLKEFTLTGWIRRGGPQAARTGLFGQNDLIEFGYIDDSTLELYLASGDAIDIANPISDEVWAFIALRGNVFGANLFVNGELLGNVDGTFDSFGTTGFNLNIGGGGVFDGAGNYFLGGIDEVAFHTRALSDGELCSLYLAGTAAPLVLAINSPGNFHLSGGTVAKEAISHGAVQVGDEDIRGGVMEFNEAQGDQVIIPADPAFNSTSGTITFWVKTAGATGAGNEGAILFDRRTSVGDVIVLKDDGSVFVQASGGPSFATGTHIADDTWHHIAYVYDQSAGGATTLYIDGNNAGSKTTTGAWSWPTAQPIELGRSHDGYWKRFNGRMDDVRLYNRMLTEGEIGGVVAGDNAQARVASDALLVLFDFNAPGSGLVLTWPCGTLQAASSVGAGGVLQWEDVQGAASPFGVRANTQKSFYRVRY